MSEHESDPAGHAAADWLPKIYTELRQKAQVFLRDERLDHTLNATALVHEAYLKLAGTTGAPEFEKTGHFFAAAAEAMRRILVDHARARVALKRGGRAVKVDTFIFENLPQVAQRQTPEEVLALDEALSRLEQQDKQAATVVRLRYFAGLEIEQVAKVMGASPTTVKRVWKFARAWLYRELNEK